MLKSRKEPFPVLSRNKVFQFTRHSLSPELNIMWSKVYTLQRTDVEIQDSRRTWSLRNDCHLRNLWLSTDPKTRVVYQEQTIVSVPEFAYVNKVGPSESVSTNREKFVHEGVAEGPSDLTTQTVNKYVRRVERSVRLVEIRVDFFLYGLYSLDFDSRSGPGGVDDRHTGPYQRSKKTK